MLIMPPVGYKCCIILRKLARNDASLNHAVTADYTTKISYAFKKRDHRNWDYADENMIY